MNDQGLESLRYLPEAEAWGRRTRSRHSARISGGVIVKRNTREEKAMRSQTLRRKWPPTGAVVLTLLASSPSGSAHPTRDIVADRQLVDEYRAGSQTADGDIAWLSDDPSVVARVVAPASGWTPMDLMAAAMLHTDASLRLAKAGRRADAVVHVDAASTLLRAAVDRESERSEFARRWRDTVAGRLHDGGLPDVASTLRTHAVIWLRESEEQFAARAAFEMGIISEIHAAVAGPLSGPPPKHSSVVPPQARWELNAAARHFESALATDPNCVEAALHLGRVRLLVGREREAERWLRIASGADSVPVRYLGMMFLGVLAERQARYADAETQYRNALRVFRWGQSAPLALSHLLMRTGREPEARDVLAMHFATTRGRVVDPLWTYLADPATDPGVTLNQLRAEVWP